MMSDKDTEKPVKILACYNVWNDDALLKLSLTSIHGQVDDAVFVLGPYEHYPMPSDIEQSASEYITEVNDRTEFLVRRIYPNAKVLRNKDRPWPEIEKRNAYLDVAFEYMSLHDFTHVLVIDADEQLLLFPNQKSLKSIIEPLKDSVIGVPIVTPSNRAPRPITLPPRIWPIKSVEKYDKTHYHLWNHEDQLVKADWNISPLTLSIIHMVGARSPDRQRMSELYYKAVVDKQLEEDAQYWKLIAM